MFMDKKVDILLATYNGEKYLAELIESIIKQSHNNWLLLIRDDGSKDKTMDIINGYCKKYPDKINLVKDLDRNIGVVKNFSRLINYSKSNYIMFSDQDDIWLPDKIKLCLEKISTEETKHRQDFPLLVHTDLKVVDENLNVISESFWNFKKLDPEKGSKIGTALCHNVVTGCTVMFNKALKDNIKDIPEKTIMHDWWLNLLAISLGKVLYINTPTILYRQHSNNTLGAGIDSSIKNNLMKLSNTDLIKKYIAKMRKINLDSQLQAKIILEMYKDRIDKDKRHVIEEYSNLANNSFFKRKLTIKKYNFSKIGLIRNISMFFIS